MQLSTISLSLALGVATNTIGGTSASYLRSSPRNMIGLDKADVRECSPEEPCGHCQGDCDTDADCAGELICYHREAAETNEGAIVPGCDGLSYSRTDWCVLPPEPIPLPEIEDEDDDDNVNDALSGFESGMSNDIAGLWVGEEKWKNDGIHTYCSSATFLTKDSGSYSTLDVLYLGNETETCEDMGISPKTGGVDNPEFFTLYDPNEHYFHRVEYKTCLAEEDCTYDVTTSEGFEDYEVVASSCGAHLEQGVVNDWYSCELYQVSRLQKKDSPGETIDVAVLTYSSFEGGFANFACPNKPTYDLEEVNEDPLAQGTTRFVLQSGGVSDTSEWECLV